jgi:hypothetical protein
MQLNLFTSATGDENLAESVAPPKKPVTQSDLQLSVRFREMAEAMQASIDEKSNPPILSGTITARKLRIGRGIEQEAEYLQQIQRCLLALATALQNGTLPFVLTRVRTRALVEQIYCDRQEPASRLIAAGIELRVAHDALKQLLAAHPVELDPERERQRELRRLQQWAAIANIPGYFPTPPNVVQEMIKLLDLTPGITVLEPSAGSGHIAQALFTFGCEVDCVEIETDLAKLLSLKGFKVYHQDFLTFRGVYSRIAMNPDFTSNGDAIHIRHAYENCLTNGGILVAISSSGIFDRSGKIESKFRDWFYGVGGVAKSLPKDAFKKGDRPVGVSTKILTLRK